MILVELVQNIWPQIVEELGRWRQILLVPWARVNTGNVP